MVAKTNGSDPGASAIRCEPWDIGPEVRGYSWRVPDPRAALLLQHGYGEYAWRFLNRYNRLIPHLLRTGVNVYAYDMRGHGNSPGVAGATDVRQAVRDHLAARRKLREQPFPVVLFGHSLGGLVTACSVARDGNDVSGVILSSPALRATVWAVSRALAAVLGVVAPMLPVRRASEAHGLSRLAEERDHAVSDPLFYSGWMRARLAASTLAMMNEGWSRYHSWRVPTLVLHGTADTHTDPGGSQQFVEAIASTDKTLHLFEGGYHELLNDTVRDQALQLLLKWLQARLPLMPT
jgi:alpha-beta hydrolase superfamily lysophospholipase